MLPPQSKQRTAQEPPKSAVPSSQIVQDDSVRRARPDDMTLQQAAAHRLHSASHSVPTQQCLRSDGYQPHPGEGTLPHIFTIAHAPSYWLTIGMVAQSLWE